MTVSEFKLKYPEHANLEGDELWNKMEDVMLENSKPATPEDMKKFFAPHEGSPKKSMESYRMIFIDTSKYNE